MAYFCGYEYVEKEPAASEASIRRFRNLIGEDGYNEIMKELLRVGIKVGVLKKKTWTRRLSILLSRLKISNIRMMLILWILHEARL